MRGPFERHLADAIVVNRLRAPIYAALSGGRSRRISGRLIAAETMLIPVARWFDWGARHHEAAGVPVLSVCFVGMDGLRRAERVPPPDSGRPAHDRSAATAALMAAFRRQDDASLADALGLAIAPLAPSPGDAMRRHLLESAQRILAAVPARADAARARGLPDPRRLLRRLLRLHLTGLGAADRLDDLAWPLQRDGIPILVHDLPAIPLSHAAGAAGRG